MAVVPSVRPGAGGERRAGNPDPRRDLLEAGRRGHLVGTETATQALAGRPLGGAAVRAVLGRRVLCRRTARGRRDDLA
jgi:hypothetical protein